MIPTMSIAKPQDLPISADEARLLTAFRCMDQRRKLENLVLLERDAERHPTIKRPSVLLGIRLAAVAGKLVAA